MAISFSGNLIKYYTLAASAQHNWCGVTQASQFFFLRIDSAATNSIPGGDSATLLGKVIFDYWHSFQPSAGPTVTTRFHVTGPGGNGQVDVPLTVGVVYGIAITWDGVAGHQVLWISGQPYTLANVTGAVTTSFAAMTVGLNVANMHVNFTIGNLYILDGYVLSTGDKTALLNGSSPPTIGTAAAWRGYYSLDGTNGQTPVFTDGGLQNAIDGTLNFASQTGTGTALYSAPLVWTPTVTATPYVAGCGNMIGATFTLNADGSPVIPSQVLVIPTITVNGTSLGALTIPWVTGFHECILWSTPGGVMINPGDTVTIAAPSAWCNTPEGPVAALSGAINNRSGGSSVQVQNLTKTLRVGADFGVAQEFYPFNNCKYLVGQTGNFGKLTPGLGYPLVNQPCEDGLVLLVWDALKPLTPAICQLSSGDSARVTVTHVPQYDVSPSNGIGYQRVYQISYVGGSDYETVANGSPVWWGYVDPGYDGTSINYDNLWVYLAGEWSIDGGGNPVFDRSDQYAISKIHLDRISQNVGSLRGFLPGAGSSETFPYPELILPNSIEWFWGFTPRIAAKVGFVSAGPVDVMATPWIYSAQFRQPANLFTATLTDTISTTPAVGTNETWHFSDGATAPLMTGLEIQVDNEICRIISGAGTAWIVYRGSNGTTPATHSPGPVTVFGRVSIRSKVSADGTAAFTAPVLIQCDKPHGMTTLQGFNPIGHLPMTMIDGATGTTFSEPDLGLSQTYVTGPTSFVSIWSGWYVSRPAGAKPSTTYTLNPANNFSQTLFYANMPHQMFIEHVAKFPNCNLHLNVPMDGCDDMYWTLARLARDHFPAGRKIYIEWANEPWNWAPPFKCNGYCIMMGPLALPSGLNTSGNPLPYYPYRSGQAHAIFRQVFTTAGRGNEIMGLINCQVNSGSTQITPHLNLGLALGTPFDAVSEAPYYTNNMSGNGTAATIAAINQYDNGQVAEQFLHDLMYDSTGMPGWLKADAAAVNAYNAANGKNCIRTVYEGGPSQTIPATATSAGSRQHDIYYNPNMYQFMLGYYMLMQTAGFQDYHQSGIGYGWPDAYPMYRMRTQRHSKGDGLGGAADNRNLCITSGAPGFFSGSPLKQDRHADSVVGQAYIDWLAQVASGTSAATAYTLVAPTPNSGPINTASGSFTVQPNGPYTGTITITPSGGGLSTPIVLTWTNSLIAQTFTITPTVSGAVTLTATNSDGLTNPDALTYTTTSATTYTFTGPSSGLVGVASSVFTVQPNGPYTGTITVTPTGGGLIAPTVLTWASSSTAQTFSIVPSLAGTVTLTPTNSGILTDQGILAYTVTAPAPGTTRTPWLGSWFSRWFAAGSSVSSGSNNSTSTAGGLGQGGASAVSFHDVDAPRLRHRFVPWTRRGYRPRGR